MGDDRKYVGYETAVWLKANGFCEPVSALWIGDAESHYLNCEEIKTDDYNGGGTELFSAPEIQVAMKWCLDKFGEFYHVPKEFIDYFWEEHYKVNAIENKKMRNKI